MPSSIADQMMERRAALIAKATEIAQKGVTEGRSLTHEENQSFDGMIAEAEEILVRAKSIAEGEQRAADLEASFRKDFGADRPESRDGSFGKWVRESRAGELFDMAIESRDMSGSGGLGKAGVASTLWEYAVAQSEILGYATLMTTTDGNTIPMPKATVHAELDSVDLAAHDPIVEDDSTLTTVDLAVAKRGFRTDVPNELIQDATFDVEGYIARNAGRALGANIAAAAEAAAISGFTTAGVTAPNAQGLTASLGDQATAGEGSDLLVDMFHSVISPYRASAKCAWGMGDLSAAIVRKLKTTTGEPVWQPSLVAGNPDLILGKPVFIATSFDAFATSKKPIFFGDWSALVVRIAGGLRFERSAEAGFGNDQTVFRALVRRGAVALDSNAVKHYATAAS